MDEFLKNSIWNQFGAAIDMLDNAMMTCPDQLWETPLWTDPPEEAKYSQFWYLAYHCLFWLDLYLTGSVEDFTPPALFNLDELDPAGLLPERPYTLEELQDYLDHCLRKCRTTIQSLTDEKAKRHCRFPWGEMSFVELLFYNLRHVQEHSAQMNLFLGQSGVTVPGWVKFARSIDG